MAALYTGGMTRVSNSAACAKATCSQQRHSVSPAVSLRGGSAHLSSKTLQKLSPQLCPALSSLASTSAGQAQVRGTPTTLTVCKYERIPTWFNNDENQKEGCVMELQLSQIRRPLAKSRANDPEKVAMLAESIAEIGLQEPIDVLEVDGLYYGFSGCHRFEAHQRLGKGTIRCNIIKSTQATLRLLGTQPAQSVGSFPKSAGFRRLLSHNPWARASTRYRKFSVSTQAAASQSSIGPTSDDANATSAFDMTSPAPPSSEGSNYLFSVSHNPWARASTRVRNLSVATRASQSTNGLTAEEQVLDTRAVAKWIGATALQWLLMCGALGGLQFVTNQMTVVCSGVVASTGPKVLVGLFFAFCSLRSRVFSPLDNSRPKQADEGKAIQERKRPSWMPPPLAFPIIWTTIAVLRTVSSVIVWEACGRELLVVPLVAMCLHLSIGDTWNTINNVERRLGTAVLGVGCVWLSVIGVDYLYFQTQTLAGALLAPSCLWITIATFLVYTIWGLNGKEPMLPMKSVSA